MLSFYDFNHFCSINGRKEMQTNKSIGHFNTLTKLGNRYRYCIGSHHRIIIKFLGCFLYNLTFQMLVFKYCFYYNITLSECFTIFSCNDSLLKVYSERFCNQSFCFHFKQSFLDQIYTALCN